MSAKTVAVIGLGLIGGSLAKAATAVGFRCVGTDIRPEVVKKAIADGTVESEFSNGMSADIYIVALFLQDAIDYVIDNLYGFSKGSIIIDVSGNKEKIAEQLTSLCAENGLYFVGTHPMEGKTHSGYDYSDAELFKKATMIITEVEGSDKIAIESVDAFAKKIGFYNTLHCTAEHHDAMISYTSQLPHVLSGAYIQNDKSTMHHGFSAGSFRDLSRVSELCPEMWCGLMFDNRKYLIEDIDTYIEVLNRYKTALENGDKAALKQILSDGNEAKIISG